MIRRSNDQTSFFEDIIYDRVFKDKKHWLLDLQQVVDFEQFRPIIEEPYSEGMGRPTNPVILFKVVFLQFVADLSDRKIEEAVNYNLLYKYFAGLAADEEAPDHSTVSRFRKQLGSDRFMKIFNMIVQQARASGVVSDRLRLVDATHIHARVDLFAPQKNTRKNKRKGGKGKPPKLPGSPDPDAAFGHKTPDKGFYGYKAHVGTDADSSIITDLRVTPGNYDDGTELPWLIHEHPPEALTADKGYDYRNNHNHCKKLGIKDAIIRKGNKITPLPELAKQRKKVERTFAVMKQWHGMAKARYWGLPNVTIQALMTAIVMNCRNLVKIQELRMA